MCFGRLTQSGNPSFCSGNFSAGDGCYTFEAACDTGSDERYSQYLMEAACVGEVSGSADIAAGKFADGTLEMCSEATCHHHDGEEHQCTCGRH